MNWLQEMPLERNLKNNLSIFLKHYGQTGLEQALKFYINMQQEYICKNQTSIYKIKICDIFYLRIQKHNITIHTDCNIYHKYGTLKNELKFFSKYNFVRCNQSCIVSLEKIKTIHNNDIILTNNAKLHMSRTCTHEIIIHFFNFSNSKK